VPDPSIGWHPHFEVWALFLSILGGYFWALRRIGPRHVSPGEAPASRGQVTAFVLGVLTMWIAADWPIHELAEERLFSVHMLQHLMLSLVGPPLLLIGTPGWLFRAVVRPRWLFAVVRTLSRPICSSTLTSRSATGLR
jgi:putative membrane protein